MPIRIRSLKNRKRGTEVTYATIPIEEARNVDEEEIRNKFQKYYGHDKNYGDLATQIRAFSSQHDSSFKDEVVPIKNQKDEPFQKTSRNYLTLKKVGKRVLITPPPAVHDVWGGTNRVKRMPMFQDVLKILSEGFRGRGDEDNAFIKRDKNHRFNFSDGDTSFFSKEKDETYGDQYSFELFSDSGREFTKHGWGAKYVHGIESAKPERILSVNIRLNPESSKKEKETKMKFYKEQITERYNVPVRFYETSGKIKKYKSISSTEEEQIEEGEVIGRIFPEASSLEKRLFLIIGISGIVLSIIFSTSNITGNTISGLSNKTTSFLGFGLFIVGLIGCYFWLKNRK